MAHNAPLTIWSNQGFHDAEGAYLAESVKPHTLVWSTNRDKNVLKAGSTDPAAREADILYGQPHPEDVLGSSRVKYVQLTSAGYTNYDKPEFLGELKRRGVIFCNASGLYDEPCAQHAAAQLLAMARALPMAVEQQAKRHWDMPPVREKSFLLGGQKVLLVGYGAIAKRLAELLAPYRFDLLAFRRSPKGNENVKTLPIDTIDQHLPTADVVISILPASASTKHFFDAARFARFKRGAVYQNIGRGDTNDQLALVDALKSGQISQAYLDVASPEPLPADHPLWQTPNCHITPHTAGGTFDEHRRMADYFLANLRRFDRGEPVINRIV